MTLNLLVKKFLQGPTPFQYNFEYPRKYLR